MKKKVFYRYLLGGLLMAVAAACSGSDDDNTVPTPTDDTPKKVHLTITQTDNDGNADARLLDGTRATLDESGKTLVASWVAGDKLTYYKINSGLYLSGELTASTSAPVSVFTGEMSCEANDKLAVIYPALNLKATPLSTYDITPYTISLSGQNGTLEKLATTFHYVYGVATVESVTGTTASATMPKMKSLLTVCKFSFKDKENNNDILVKELKISFTNGVVGQGDAGTYPQSATVTPNDDQTQVHAVAVTGSSTPLTITLPSASTDVYVALLPTPEATDKIHFNFVVTDKDDQNYSGTARAYLKEGQYVIATGLKLTK